MSEHSTSDTEKFDVTSIKVIPSQTDMYEGEWDVIIRTTTDSFYITVGAGDADVAMAWEKAVEAGKFVPEAGERDD